MGGEFNMFNAAQYFAGLRRRLAGEPFNHDSESEEESESSIEFEENASEDEMDEEYHEIDDYYLLSATKNTIHLIDPALDPKQSNNNMHVAAAYIPELEVHPGTYTRLSLLEYVEELSLCVVGNQRGRELILLRVAQTDEYNTQRPDINPQSKVSFVPEASIMLQRPILGLFLVVDKSSETTQARIYVITEGSLLYIIQVGLKNEFNIETLRV